MVDPVSSSKFAQAVTAAASDNVKRSVDFYLEQFNAKLDDYLLGVTDASERFETDILVSGGPLVRDNLVEALKNAGWTVIVAPYGQDAEASRVFVRR